MITGGVLGSFGELQLDVPSRSRARCRVLAIEQLAVDQQRARQSAVGDHHRIRGLPVGHAQLQAWFGAGPSGRRLLRQPELLSDCGPQSGVPVGELAVEIGAGVALATVPDSNASVRGQLLVDQCGYGLVGGGPVHVAAAEDGEGEPRGCVGGSGGIGDPAAEAFGVVRRLPVLRGAHNNQGSFVRQLAGVIIQRTKRDRVATI